MNLLTHTNEAEGKIGIGTLPPDLHPIIDDIYNEYYTTIPDKNVTTYHTWYHTLSPTLKEKLGKIQTHPFWNKLCNNQQTCIKINVKEMDELYYSNFTKTVENVTETNLYGATGNIVIHKDCHYICSFHDVSLYRIIIGLSPNKNTNISTKFVHFNKEKKINKNDYILFDFSRTTHQVIKENPAENTPRTLLKLHFLVCNNCSKYYIEFLKKYFIIYDNITRYILKTGTEPTTYYQFFIGLLTHYFYHPYTQPLIAVLFILYLIKVKFASKIKLVQKNIPKILVYFFVGVAILYLFVVFCYWARFQLYGVR
jgi:hypothetical protein